MKRYISLILVAVVLIYSLAVPASATGIGLDSNDAWLDVMDFTDLGQVYTKSGDNYVTVPLPLSKVYYGFDFIVHDRTGINEVYFKTPYDTVAMNKVSIGNGLIRYHIKSTWTGDEIQLIFNCKNTDYQWFQFLSFRVHYTQTDTFNSYSLAEGYFPNEGSFNLNSETAPGVVWHSTPTDTGFSLDLYCPDWRKYDFVDFTIIGLSVKVTSVSANMVGINVPIQYSFLDTYAYSDVPFTMTVRIDVRGLDRSSDSAPCVVISGDSTPDEYCSISLISCVGLIVTNDIDPFFIYFRDLGLKVATGFGSVITSIETWGRNIVDAINPDSSVAEDAINQGSQAADQLTDLTEQMNSLEKPDLSGAGDISAIISPGDLSSYTVFLSTVVNAPYIGQVVMLALILSLAAYVLFGKR